MICLRKHHQCRVIAESFDSMNISHFEHINDLLIAFWERSRSLLNISQASRMNSQGMITNRCCFDEGLIHPIPKSAPRPILNLELEKINQ